MSQFPSNSSRDREAILQTLSKERQHFDLVVVGGGITGAGVLREAATKGLRVLLVEQKDFAWGTSSRSSKMVHGGLRYLGKGQFGLANDSVKERQRLVEQLPGLVNLLPFAMNHYQGKFPGPWIFDKLLAIYDWMAGRRYRRFLGGDIASFWLPGIKTDQLMGTTLFADAVTDDAGLVMRVLGEARRYGGIALNYVKATGIDVTSVSDGKQTRELKLHDVASGCDFSVSANVVVNATGAWTDELRACLGQGKRIRPLRGSHLLVPFWRLPVAFSVTFLHPDDKRPVFVFPWEGQTVVGTTDLDHSASLSNEASISAQELSYLLDAANAQFSHAELSTKDIVSTWSGVRPVVMDEGENESSDASPSQATREHEIWDDQGMISIAGGKLTTFRLLALEALEKSIPYLADKLDRADFKRARNFSELDCVTHPKLNSRQIVRLQARFGADLPVLLENCSAADFQSVGVTDFVWGELRWMCALGMVVHLDDLLLRRTRIGLLLENGAAALLPQIQSYLKDDLPWDADRWQQEIRRYAQIIRQHYSVPLIEQDQEQEQGKTARDEYEK